MTRPAASPPGRWSRWWRSPPGLILGGTVLYSMVPLSVKLGVETGNDPWSYQLGLSAGRAAGALAILCVFQRAAFTQPGVSRALIHRVFSWSALWKAGGADQRRSLALLAAIAVSQANTAFYAWSAVFVDMAVATIVRSVGPVLFIAGMARMHSKGRYRQLTMGDGLALALAFVSVSLVTWVSADHVSQAGGSLWASVLGAALAVFSSVTILLGMRQYRWGRERRKEIKGMSAGGEPPAEWALVTLAYGAANFLLVPAGLALALPGGISGKALLYGLVFGALASSPAAVMIAKANLDTANLMANSARYAQAFLSLGWLALFTTVDVGNVPLVSVGAVGVVAANALSNPALRTLCVKKIREGRLTPPSTS